MERGGRFGRRGERRVYALEIIPVLFLGVDFYLGVFWCGRVDHGEEGGRREG